MGMMKQLKDMKGMMEDAPDMIKNAQAMGAQAQEMAAAQQAAAQAQMAGVANMPGMAGGSYAPDPAALTPIGGVTLEQYAEIAKAIAASGNSDAETAKSVAAGKGVSGDNWAEAVEGWNQRIKTNGGVAHQFNQLYAG